MPREVTRMDQPGFGRRELLAAGAVAVGTAWAGRAFAADAPHHHGGARGDAALADTALACVSTGDACLAHCLEEFRAGRVGLGDCATNVQQMLAACGALAQLAAAASPHLPAFAAATAAVCQSCEDACRKHEQEHEICRRCADACARCRKECQRAARAA
jgi:Cys-rich four helix bundle protein (predicted Tat secretion target)